MRDAILSNNVRYWRKIRGLTQTTLAEQVGITRQSIIAIEKGRLNPSIAVVLNLAAALDASVEDLFTLQRSSAPQNKAQALGEGEFHIGVEPIGQNAFAKAAKDSPQQHPAPGSVWDFV